MDASADAGAPTAVGDSTRLTAHGDSSKGIGDGANLFLVHGVGRTAHASRGRSDEDPVDASAELTFMYSGGPCEDEIVNADIAGPSRRVGQQVDETHRDTSHRRSVFYKPSSYAADVRDEEGGVVCGRKSTGNQAVRNAPADPGAAYTSLKMGGKGVSLESAGVGATYLSLGRGGGGREGGTESLRKNNILRGVVNRSRLLPLQPTTVKRRARNEEEPSIRRNGRDATASKASARSGEGFLIGDSSIYYEAGPRRLLGEGRYASSPSVGTKDVGPAERVLEASGALKTDAAGGNGRGAAAMLSLHHGSSHVVTDIERTVNSQTKKLALAVSLAKRDIDKGSAPLRVPFDEGTVHPADVQYSTSTVGDKRVDFARVGPTSGPTVGDGTHGGMRCADEATQRWQSPDLEYLLGRLVSLSDDVVEASRGQKELRNVIELLKRDMESATDGRHDGKKGGRRRKSAVALNGQRRRRRRGPSRGIDGRLAAVHEEDALKLVHMYREQQKVPGNNVQSGDGGIQPSTPDVDGVDLSRPQYTIASVSLQRTSGRFFNRLRGRRSSEELGDDGNGSSSDDTYEERVACEDDTGGVGHLELDDGDVVHSRDTCKRPSNSGAVPPSSGWCEEPPQGKRSAPRMDSDVGHQRAMHRARSEVAEDEGIIQDERKLKVLLAKADALVSRLSSEEDARHSWAAVAGDMDRYEGEPGARNVQQQHSSRVVQGGGSGQMSDSVTVAEPVGKKIMPSETGPSGVAVDLDVPVSMQFESVHAITMGAMAAVKGKYNKSFQGLLERCRSTESRLRNRWLMNERSERDPSPIENIDQLPDEIARGRSDQRGGAGPGQSSGHLSAIGVVHGDEAPVVDDGTAEDEVAEGADVSSDDTNAVLQRPQPDAEHGHGNGHVRTTQCGDEEKDRSKGALLAPDAVRSILKARRERATRHRRKDAALIDEEDDGGLSGLVSGARNGLNPVRICNYVTDLLIDDLIHETTMEIVNSYNGLVDSIVASELRI